VSGRDDRSTMAAAVSAYAHRARPALSSSGCRRIGEFIFPSASPSRPFACACARTLPMPPLGSRIHREVSGRSFGFRSAREGGPSHHDKCRGPFHHQVKKARLPSRTGQSPPRAHMPRRKSRPGPLADRHGLAAESAFVCVRNRRQDTGPFGRWSPRPSALSSQARPSQPVSKQRVRGKGKEGSG